MSKSAGGLVLTVGIVLAVAGIAMVVVGIGARGEVVQGMLDEEVTTEITEGEVVPVKTAATAMAQYNLIKDHTLGSFGSYSSLEREDPRRATYVTGLTLRNSLVIGRMGLQVGLLIVGLGGLFFLTGGALAAAGMSARRKE
jgi:hypothetical protein